MTERLPSDDVAFTRLAGIEVAYLAAGPVDAPAVLLFHHFHGSVDSWRYVIGPLARGHRVVAFDRPGFGSTERPDRARWTRGNPYTRARSALIAIRLLDHLGIRTATLVGASAGGTIALETFARYPDRVSGIGLISPAITGDPGPPGPLRPLLRSGPARAGLTAIGQRIARNIGPDRVARAWHDPSRVTELDVEVYRRPMRAPDWAASIVETFVAERPPDLRAVLGRIDVPALVVAGRSDRVVRPSWNRRTAAAIPGAGLTFIDGAGHTPHEETPEELLRALAPLLDEAASRRRQSVLPATSSPSAGATRRSSGSSPSTSST